MTDSDLAALARAATPGPWQWIHEVEPVFSGDAKHIEQWSPERALAALAVIAAARSFGDTFWDPESERRRKALTGALASALAPGGDK